MLLLGHRLMLRYYCSGCGEPELTRRFSGLLVLQNSGPKSAACCADCFTPLAPTASVTMIRRRVLTARGETWLRVPICLTCWLVHLESKTAWSRALLRLRGRADHNEFAFELNGPLGQLVRFRCGGCGRPIRSLGRPVRSRRVCCADCARKVYNEYYPLRRRRVCRVPQIVPAQAPRRADLRQQMPPAPIPPAGTIIGFENLLSRPRCRSNVTPESRSRA